MYKGFPLEIQYLAFSISSAGFQASAPTCIDRFFHLFSKFHGTITRFISLDGPPTFWRDGPHAHKSQKIEISGKRPPPIILRWAIWDEPPRTSLLKGSCQLNKSVPPHPLSTNFCIHNRTETSIRPRIMNTSLNFFPYWKINSSKFLSYGIFCRNSTNF